jgi:hypothetical protein
VEERPRDEEDRPRYEEERPAVEERRIAPRRPVRSLRDYDPEPQPEREEFGASSDDAVIAPAWFAVTRATAFFIGAFVLLNLLTEMRCPQLEASDWWLNLQPLGRPMVRGFLALTGVLLVFFSFFPRANTPARLLTAVCTLGLFGAAVWNTVRFYHAFRAGEIHTDVPIPFSLHIAASAAVILPGVLTACWERSNFFKDFLLGMMTLAICIVGLPLAQMFCVGKIDDRQAADAIVIVSDIQKKDDDPDPLPERIRAGSTLYREGLARKVVLVERRSESADQSASPFRRLAVEQGIAEADIVADVSNPKLDAAIAESVKPLQDQKLARVLVTGPFYSLPRLKLSYARAGMETHAVPSRDAIRPKELRVAMIREVGAFWLGFLQPLLK